MAESSWNSRELQSPPTFKDIQRNAQNAINNLDILLKLAKQGADVAKLFVLLVNPAGAIIKIAADEIIKLCNDFKEIGVFYLFINPNDESYGNQTDREFGLVIAQDENGLYQFKPSFGKSGQEFYTVGEAYQKTLAIADLPKTYKDKSGRDKDDPKKNINLFNLKDDPLEEYNIESKNSNYSFNTSSGVLIPKYEILSPEPNHNILFEELLI